MSVPHVLRAQADPAKFNLTAELPYELRLADFELAMQDVYDLLFDINSALLSRGLMRLEETVRPAIFQWHSERRRLCVAGASLSRIDRQSLPQRASGPDSAWPIRQRRHQRGRGWSRGQSDEGPRSG